MWLIPSLPACRGPQTGRTLPFLLLAAPCLSSLGSTRRLYIWQHQAFLVLAAPGLSTFGSTKPFYICQHQASLHLAAPSLSTSGSTKPLYFWRNPCEARVSHWPSIFSLFTEAWHMLYSKSQIKASSEMMDTVWNTNRTQSSSETILSCHGYSV